VLWSFLVFFSGIRVFSAGAARLNADFSLPLCDSDLVGLAVTFFTPRNLLLLGPPDPLPQLERRRTQS